MIERYLIRYFLAVIDSGNFSRAANAVNVTQPTLSAGIAKLEQLLGTDLFRRNNRRIHLTPAGTRFLPFARRIESEFNQCLLAVKPTMPTSQLRIGLISTVSIEIVHTAVKKVLQQYPTLQIEIIDGSERELRSKLSQGRLDVALTLVDRGGDKDVEQVILEEGYCAVLPPEHPLVGREKINAEDLADSVMIVRRQCEVLGETSRFFTERGVRPFFAYRSSQDERVMGMVEAGLGLTIIPRSHRVRNAWKAELIGFDYRRKIGFIFSKSPNANSYRDEPALQLFHDILAREARPTILQQ